MAAQWTGLQAGRVWEEVVEGLAEADQLVDLLLQCLHISPQPVHCWVSESDRPSCSFRLKSNRWRSCVDEVAFASVALVSTAFSFVPNIDCSYAIEVEDL